MTCDSQIADAPGWKALQTAPILQGALPFDPLAPRPLPGVAPLEMADWLITDEAFAAQMAQRDRLVAQCPGAVLAEEEQARAPALEALDAVLDALKTAPGYVAGAGEMRRSDGVTVALDRAAPMRTLARLVQEDICLMERRAGWDEHRLTAAALCFPAAWTLAEKIGRPMLAIHDPVPVYDSNIAKRVQRLLDGVRPGRPIWRFNGHAWHDAHLFQPRPEALPRPYEGGEAARFWRAERQTLLRLPQSGAVLFSIHTYVLARSDLPEALFLAN